MAMDRAQILLIGIPLFLFFYDIVSLFAPHPPPPPHHHHHHHPHHHHPPHHHHHPPHHHPHPPHHPPHHHPHPPHHHPHPPHHPPHHHPHPPHHPPHRELQQATTLSETLDVPSQDEVIVGGLGLGSRIDIMFCSSCSYRGNALTMKKMLETAFPGIDVALANHPPALHKRIISKLVPVAQIGAVGLVVAGEHIFPLLGFMTPPPWYYSLRANKFGTIASSWLLGNALQSFLQSTGAFEVYLNNELIFSKLKEGRFPGEIELRNVVGKKLGKSGVGGLWT